MKAPEAKLILETTNLLSENSHTISRYAKATDWNSLNVYLGEALLEAAVMISLFFQKKPRGRYYYQILKFFNRKIYNQYWGKNFELTMECLVFASIEMKSVLKEKYKFNLGINFIYDSVAAGAAYYSEMLLLDKATETMLSDKFASVLIHYQNKPEYFSQTFLSNTFKKYCGRNDKRAKIKFSMAIREIVGEEKHLFHLSLGSFKSAYERCIDKHN